MAFVVALLSGISCILICGVLCQPIDVPIRRVTIPQGVVVGTVVNDNHFEFYGIPFADSTSGINRFKAPSAPPLFKDEFIANRRNIKCVHALGVGFEGTEDCLTADILTPSLDPASQLPVMVWIKGKELDTNNDLEPSFERFLEKDVIIVSLNHRESILGFLCLGTESAPGNAGLKDIIAGLRWVQENIAAFGGDPNNVSLFGHGSGAAAVDLVILSPMAEGLVHKAITQSGTAMAPWAVTRNNLKYAVDVAEALGHTISTIDTLTEVFSRTSVAALMAVINELDLTDNSLAFAPCIERPIENVEPLLLKSPYAIITEGEQLKIPFVTGFVDIEGTIRANEIVDNDWLERMNNSFVDFLQPDIDFKSYEEEIKAAEEIKSFYFENESINENKISEALLYNGDTMILVSAIREARMRVTSLSSAPVYLYQFSYKGNLSEELLERPLEVDSAGHKEELVYMFSNEGQTDSTLDLAIGDILIERWTNFAKNGIPTSNTSQVVWEPYTLSNSNYLRFLDDQEIRENNNYSTLELANVNPHPETIKFWDSVYTRYFADAKSRWALEDRNDEEGGGSGEEGGSGDEEGEGGGDENGEEGGDGQPDSASTAVGYTFTIISLFAILHKFHVTQILS